MGIDSIIYNKQQETNNKRMKTTTNKSVDMDLYKSLVNKLEMEQNNRLKELDDPYSDVDYDSKISPSTNSQPLSRNLLSRNGYQVNFV